jgi:hypothetical protein
MIRIYIIRVIVCPASGFNSTKGKEIGYPWPTHLLSGKVSNAPGSISWNGMQSKNLSWKQVHDSMFPDFETLKKDYIFWEVNKEDVQEMNLLPFMKCFEVKNYPKLLSIASNSALNVFLTDAMRQTYYRNS